MTELQKVTTENSQNEVIVDPRHQALIDYRALNGLITDDDGMRKMTVDELATMLGTVRKVLYDWQKRIPNFWDRVNARRSEIAPTSRLARMHEVWYLSAQRHGKDGFQDRQLWLANFDPNFRMPTEKHEVDAGGGLADLLRIAQNRVNADVIPEAEIIDAGDQAA